MLTNKHINKYKANYTHSTSRHIVFITIKKLIIIGRIAVVVAEDEDAAVL